MKDFVAGAGSTNIDLIFSGLPRLPDEGEELFSQGFDLQMGGGVPATLINLGRLGVPTRIQTALGEDMFSEFARRQFAEAGVSPLDLGDGTGIPLNITAAMLTPADRTFVSYSDGAPVTEEARERVYRASTGAKVVLMQPGYLDVYRRLKAEGSVLVFDMGWDDALSLETYREYLELADYYTPNQKEALKITGASTPDGAAEVLSQFFDRVIVKLDADGCLVREHGRNFRIGTIPEYRHRDSTGAGDAFLAGLVYGIYHDCGFRESVLFGNITGGKCVTGVGCLSCSCTEPELLETARKYHSLIEG